MRRHSWSRPVHPGTVLEAPPALRTTKCASIACLPTMPLAVLQRRWQQAERRAWTNTRLTTMSDFPPGCCVFILPLCREGVCQAAGERGQEPSAPGPLQQARHQHQVRAQTGLVACPLLHALQAYSVQMCLRSAATACDCLQSSTAGQAGQCITACCHTSLTACCHTTLLSIHHLPGVAINSCLLHPSLIIPCHSIVPMEVPEPSKQQQQQQEPAKQEQQQQVAAK